VGESAVFARLRFPDERTLGGQARRGVTWSAAARVTQQLLQLGGGIVLARLLTPGDYGLTAIVWTITGFSGVFSDLGLGAAVVQCRQASEGLLATAFWLNAGVGLVLTGVLSGLSIPLAHAFGKPHVAGLLVLTSLVFVLSLSLVPTAILERSLRFDLLSKMDVAGSVIGLGVTVGCAAAGLGAKSLVLGPVAQSVASSVISLGIVRWLPRTRPDRESLRRLWTFGSGMTAFTVVNYWVRNVDNLVLGRFVDAPSLGFYSRAYNLMVLPVFQVGGVLGRVLLPVLSSLRADPPRLARAWLRAVEAAGCVALPLGLGIAVTAPDLIRTLYGGRWGPVGPLLTLLALSVPPQIVAATLGSVYQALGQTRLLASQAVSVALVNVVAVVVAVPFGTTGVCVGLLVSAYVIPALIFPPAFRILHVSAREVLVAVRPGLLGSLAMILAIAAVRFEISGLPVQARFSLEVVVGAVSYVGALSLFAPDLLAAAVARFRRLGLVG
jgi:PST family polysaccharide transporter